jgi:tetratricopeptide (TPR) repeat protein
MRRLIVTFALLLTVSPAAWGQPNPERPLPRLPPLGQLPPDPQQPDPQQPDSQAPDQQPDQQQPDSQPGPQQRGAPGAPPGRGGVAGRPTPRPPETDDQLLARLGKAADRRAARPIENELRARWAHSDSPSADLLLKRADQAIKAHDSETALTIVQKLTDIAPDFAEGWHRRATLAAEKDDYQDAIAALRRVLALQPKHFVAMAELGQILEEFDDKSHALDAYRQAKALDPFIDGLDDRIRQLTKEVEGQGI